jgi:hypothetical protein
VDDTSGVKITGAVRDLRIAGGLYVGADADPDDNDIWLDGDIRGAGGAWFGATVATDDPAVGCVVIDQGAADTEILDLISSDVGTVHGDQAHTGTYGMVQKYEAAAGGLWLRGFKDSEGIAGGAFAASGYLAENVDTTKGTGGRSVIEIGGYECSGGSIANITADGNVLGVWTRKGGSYQCILIVDEDGDIHVDGSSSLATFDEYNDPLLCRALTLETTPEQAIRTRFDEFVEYGRDDLEAAGILSPEGFLNQTQLARLLTGTTWQLYQMVELAKQEIVRLGGDPERLALPA